MSQARLHARAGSPDPSEGTVVVGCTAQGRVLRNRPIKFKKRHRGLTESVRCLVTNVTKGRRKHKQSERHAGAQTLTRYTLEKPQHRMMRFGWKGSRERCGKTKEARTPSREKQEGYESTMACVRPFGFADVLIDGDRRGPMKNNARPRPLAFRSPCDLVRRISLREWAD